MSRTFRIWCSLALLLAGIAVMPATPAAATDAPWAPPGLYEAERGSRTLDEIASGFPSPGEAAALLIAWEWQANAFYNYSGLTSNGTTWLEVSFHLFGSATGATEAMSYFAAGRALMYGMDPVPFTRVGDEMLAIGGWRDGVGTDVTVYLRDDAVLVRVSAIAPAGDPSQDAFDTASMLYGGWTSTPRQPRTLDDLLPTAWDLSPDGWYGVTDEGWRNQREIADTFLRPAEADPVLTQTGFIENAYRYFAFNGRWPLYPGHATTIEISLHLFATETGAFDALWYYADGRSEAIGIQIAGEYPIGDGAIWLVGPSPSGNGYESTVYMLLGNVLARISAMSPSGDPTADALALAFLVASL